MYELIILSLLMRGATHGYVIAGVINDVIGPFARASNGRIYPLLTKLEEDGLISVKEESTSEGGRVSRSFSITEPGRERFRQLMIDTTSSPREYRDLFAFKVTAFDQLVAADRVAVLRHYIDFARAHVQHLQAQGRDLGENATRYGHSREQAQRMSAVFEHLIDVWQDEARWAEALLSAEAGTPASDRPRTKARKP
jgi:DNA-binding PadR family transcriptional regulator